MAVKHSEPGDVTAAALASLFGVTRQRVQQWATAEHCPRNADGKYPLAAVIKWRERWHTKRATENSPALERWRQAKANLAELELGKAKGQLRDAAEVEREEYAIDLQFLSGLKQLIRHMEPCIPPAGHERLKEEIDAMRTAIANARTPYKPSEVKEKETADVQS